jgi:hypothetical protein
MALRLANVFRLGVKELYSLRADPILLVMIVYAFSLGKRRTMRALGTVWQRRDNLEQWCGSERSAPAEDRVCTGPFLCRFWGQDGVRA